MNRKASLYAVIGGCVGVVLTLSVCLFLPLRVQSQPHNLSDAAKESTTMEIFLSDYDVTFDAAGRRMVKDYLLDWNDHVDDDTAMVIGLRKACVERLSRIEELGSTSELLALIEGYKEVRSWHPSRRGLTLMIEELNK